MQSLRDGVKEKQTKHAQIREIVIKVKVTRKTIIQLFSTMYTRFTLFFAIALFLICNRL